MCYLVTCFVLEAIVYHFLRADCEREGPVCVCVCVCRGARQDRVLYEYDDYDESLVVMQAGGDESRWGEVVC